MYARDLTDSDIGKVFRFEGSPVVVGTYAGPGKPTTGPEMEVIVTDCLSHSGNLWELGYWISKLRTVVLLNESQQQYYINRKKLISYLDERLREKGSQLNNTQMNHVADVFMELMKGETENEG